MIIKTTNQACNRKKQPEDIRDTTIKNQKRSLLFRLGGKPSYLILVPIVKTYKNLQVDFLFDSGFADDHLLISQHELYHLHQR